MPKSRTKTNLYDIDLVMRAIQDRFAVQVSDNPSLQRLINEIELAGYKTDLSWNTWRRLFGMIKNEHSQSITTLNILADFAGFPSWVEFLQSNSLETARDFNFRFAHYVAGNTSMPDIQAAFVAMGPSAAFYRFLQQCLILAAGQNHAEVIRSIYQNEAWFPFDVQNKDAAYEEFNLHQLVGIYCFQKSLPGFADALSENAQALKRVLLYSVQYGIGAEEYIQLFNRAVDLKLFDSESDFAHSILAHHHYLLGDADNAKFHLNQLGNYEIAPERLLPAGRIRCLQWALCVNEVSDSEIVELVASDFKVFKNKAQHLDAFSFYLLYVLRFLYHADRNELGIKILNAYYPQGPSSISFWSGVVWNRLRIYIAAIHMKLNNYEAALNTYSKIRVEWFDTFQFKSDMKDYIDLQKRMKLNAKNPRSHGKEKQG
jgi:hypothetical protein